MSRTPSVARWDGTRLAALRAAAGLTQAELAEIVDVAPLSVHFWESAAKNRAPSPRHLRRIAQALAVTTTDLAPMPEYPTLADYRVHAGLRASELAKFLGMHPVSLSDVERASLRWPAEHAEHWAQLLGITDQQFRDAWEVHRTKKSV